jgi:hypothetical protein
LGGDGNSLTIDHPSLRIIGAPGACKTLPVHYESDLVI